MVEYALLFLVRAYGARKDKLQKSGVKMEHFGLWGTIVNVIAVTVGSLLGLGLKRLINGKKEQSETMRSISDCVLKGLALCALAIGITGTVKASVDGQILAALQGSYVGSPEYPVQLMSELSSERTLIIIISMALGALIGQLLDLDKLIGRLGERVEALASNRFGNVAQGFVSASLLFCVGSMTIVGALNSGLQNDHSMLYTKSVLDFVSSIVFSVSLGIGVLFSAAFVLVFQGSITLLAQWVAPFLSGEVITCMTVVGSLLIIGLALNLLGLTKLKIMNYLPAVFLPVFLLPIADWLAKLF